MAAASMDHEPGYMPTYLQMIKANINIPKLYWDPQYKFPEDFISDCKLYWNVGLSEVVLCVLMANMFTLLRHVLTNLVFNPIANAAQLVGSSKQKMPESAWKFMYYVTVWSYSVYLLFYSGRHRYFHEPKLLADWTFAEQLPGDIFVLYIVQFSFYAHSVYGTLYLDVWRKDSAMMLVHHFLTMFLLFFSYVTRHHKFGILVLFLHDITDVELEFTKLNFYFKNRGGRHHRLHEQLSNVGFAMFALTWFVFRLYWYPLKVLWALHYFQPGAAAAFPYVFYGMLWCLQLMNVYWFQFILVLVYRTATGQMSEIEDIREEEKGEATDLTSRKEKNGHVTNGIHHRAKNGAVHKNAKSE